MKRKHSICEEDPPNRRCNVIENSVAQVQGLIENPTKMAEMDTEPIEQDAGESKSNSPKVFKCHVYWGKNVFDIFVDTEEPLVIFKAQIFAFTSVDPDRQKIVFEGKLLKDEEWPPKSITNGCKLRMIGTNDVLIVPLNIDEEKTTTPKAPVQKLPPLGIKNYGNTCFMNSVLQLFRAIPELKDSLIKYNREPEGTQTQILECIVVKSTAELFKALDLRTEDSERFMTDLIKNIEGLYPEYASSIEKGGRPQQDANEFFMRLMDIFKRNLNYQVNQYVKGRDLIETMFGIDLEKTITCLEKDGDSPKTSSQTELQLSCFISSDTKFMIDGIKNKLRETITKKSTLLNRDANYTITTSITRLPAYLCVQFVRFYYKEQEKVNAKILRDVKFPLRLDMSDLCCQTLKDKIRGMQSTVREFENKISLTESDSAKKVLFKKQETGVISMPEQKLALGDSGSGIYHLVAVLTHQGRSSSSGHYVSWVKTEDKKWARLDDDSSVIVEEEDVLKLSGGGEYHTAYLLLYQTFKVPKP